MTKKSTVSTTIHLPEELRAWLEAQAEHERRGLGPYIVILLEGVRRGEFIKRRTRPTLQPTQ